MGAIDELAAAQTAASRNGTGDAESAAEQLTALLDLPSVHWQVTGGRVVGSGGSATGYLYLSNGQETAEVVFETLRDMATPKLLALEVAFTGACPKLNQQQALRAVALLHGLATHELAVTLDELTREWGLEFLQSAEVFDVDMQDQRARWAAFSDLQRRDPVAAARAESTSVARACLVLRHFDGTRVVRAGWFRAHVRSEDATVSPHDIAQRMQRVGWERRGGEGWIKATRPGHAGVLRWRFYTVPPNWEEAA